MLYPLSYGRLVRGRVRTAAGLDEDSRNASTGPNPKRRLRDDAASGARRSCRCGARGCGTRRPSSCPPRGPPGRAGRQRDHRAGRSAAGVARDSGGLGAERRRAAERRPAGAGDLVDEAVGPVSTTTRAPGRSAGSAANGRVEDVRWPVTRKLPRPPGPTRPPPPCGGGQVAGVLDRGAGAVVGRAGVRRTTRATEVQGGDREQCRSGPSCGREGPGRRLQPQGQRRDRGPSASHREQPMSRAHPRRRTRSTAVRRRTRRAPSAPRGPPLSCRRQYVRTGCDPGHSAWTDPICPGSGRR